MSMAMRVSSGNSILASKCMCLPSSVTAGVCLNRARRSRSNSAWRCLKAYSARMMGDGPTMMTPASPSMMTQSSWRTNWLALRAPTTAGMSRLRATMAVCEVLPPTSVTKPVNTLCLNCSISAGDKSWAINTSGTSWLSSSKWSWCHELVGLRAAGCGKLVGKPFMCRSKRSTTCSRSPLRSRKYASSMSSNCLATTSSCEVSAHSAL